MQASCTPNMKVSTQILRPINFVHLANQTGGILHSPPTPTQGGSSLSTLVMRIICMYMYAIYWNWGVLTMLLKELFLAISLLLFPSLFKKVFCE